MKKNLIIFCIVTMCVLLFSIFATAHPGKTDSNGGHINHSTGEYHYHHGYPAHSHYDMDEDGIRDCPYDLDDKTNHNSSSGNSSNSSDQNNKTSNSTSISESNTQKTKKTITFGKVVGIIISIIPLSLITLYLLYMVLGIIGIMIGWFIEKCFKVIIEESIYNRILHILVIIGLVIMVPLEILFILGIL